jgi:flavin-binding protein dodecin
LFAAGGIRQHIIDWKGAPLMAEHVYKHIEITGTSQNSIDEAVANGIARAAKTVKHMRWFEVTQIRGDIESGGLSHWQVSVKIGFTLED